MSRNYIVILVFLFLSCTGNVNGNSSDQGFDIRVEIKNFPDTVAYLGYHFGDQKFVKDTSGLLQSKLLHFKGEEDLKPGIYFVYSPSVYFEIIINDQQHFSIRTDTVDMMNKMEITGSKENQIFHDFQQFMAENQKKLQELNAAIGKLDQSKDADEIAEM